MLIDQNAFDKVTHILIERGTIQEFEKREGKLRGRMMITLGELPSDLDVVLDADRKVCVFNGSFDFYDTVVGVALYMDPVEPATRFWMTPQRDGAEPPADDWVSFFFETLMTHIGEDGSFSIPMYTYVNDTADFTVVPVRRD